MKRTLLFIILLSSSFGFGQNHSQLYQKYYDAVRKGNTKKAHRELSKISKVETNNLFLLITIGNFYGEIGNLDSASIYLDAAIRHKSVYPMTYSSPEAYKTRDSLFLTAISTLNEIIEYDSTAMNIGNRAAYKLDTKQFQAALVDYRIAIKLDQKKAITYYNMAIVYSAINELDSAIWAYDKSIELSPNQNSAYLNKGFVLIKKGSYKLAIEQFEHSLEFDGTTKDVSYTLNNIGYCYLKLSNYPLAQHHIDESIKLNPLNSYAFRNRALLEIELGNTGLACKAIEQSIELGFVQEYGDEILELQKSNCSH